MPGEAGEILNIGFGDMVLRPRVVATPNIRSSKDSMAQRLGGSDETREWP